MVDNLLLLVDVSCTVKISGIVHHKDKLCLNFFTKSSPSSLVLCIILQHF